MLQFLSACSCYYPRLHTMLWVDIRQSSAWQYSPTAKNFTLCSASASLLGSTLTNAQHHWTGNHDSHYAQSLPLMWQKTAPGWLEAKHETNRVDTAATVCKKTSTAPKVIQWHTVKVIILTGVRNLFNSEYTSNLPDYSEWQTSIVIPVCVLLFPHLKKLLIVA